MAQAVTRVLWLLLGAILLVLPALPLPRWAQAPDAGPAWPPYLEAWLIGLVTVGLIGVLAGRLLRGVTWPRPQWSPGRERIAVGGLGAATVAGAVAIAHHALAVNPHLIDEVAQLFQARVYLSGALAAPPPEPAGAFLFAHTWITPAGWVQQFPPAHGLWLAGGMALDLEWLVNPLLGGVSTVLVYLLARGWYGRRTAVVAAVLWAAAGWVLFMSATYMNHVSTVALALAAWTLVWGVRRPGGMRAAGAGLAVGLVAATRPLDAVAVALPIAAWLLAGRRWRAGAWMAIGGTPVLVGLGLVNAHQFGDPLTFGYTVLYGAKHNLGFHEDAYGVAYTPAIALSNMAVAARRLHIYLFEWPVPSAGLLGLWAWLGRHRHPADRWLVLATLGGPVIYFFYWHSGFYPGPRFYYIAAPGLVIGTARAALWLWKRARRWRSPWIRWDVALSASALTIMLWGLGSVLPARVREYRVERPSLKLHPERELAARGVERAVLLIPESWGSRVIVDLWTAGVTPGVVERAYRVLDTCDLHRLAAAARVDGVPAAQLTAELNRRIDAAPAPAPRLRDWPDPTVRLRARAELPAACARELRRDRAGFHLYGNYAWRNAVGLDRGVVFARDRFERNDELLDRYRGWPVWRYAPPPGEQLAPPVLTELRRSEGSGS